MTISKFLTRELPILAILIAPIIYLLIVWDKLPDQFPVHWNIKGEADKYGSKYIMPLMNIGLYLLLLILPKIDPRKKNYDIFSSTYFKLRLILVLFFSAIIAVIITKSIGFDIDMDRIVVIGVVLLFTVLGNYMGTIKPNWFIGIKLPWTLDNETVWRKTHYLAGKIWFWTGLILLILSFILPKTILNLIVFSAISVMVIIPIIFSYIILQKEKNHNYE